MPESVLFQQAFDHDKPHTHALIIGVGAYPYLVGGSAPTEKRFSRHDGMRQLTSPPHSARKMADWLLTVFKNPDKPLGSLAMLVSEADPQPFTSLVLPGPIIPRAATMENIKTAIKAWKARGDAHPDNLMLFFFCGHGIARGSDVALLAEDFGSDHDEPLAMAIDLTGLHRGMDKCRARKQCYFIDACRSPSGTLIETLNGTGESVIAGSLRNSHPNLPPREAPIFYATLTGQQAFGRPGKETGFTEILLKSLNACGGTFNSENDSWGVTTSKLQEAMDALLREESQEEGPQRLETDSLTNFLLHHLPGPPSIPVTIRCVPPEKNVQATFSYSQNNVVLSSRPPAAEDWKTSITVGMYSFSAQLPDDRYRRDAYINSPTMTVQLKESV